MMQRLTSGLTHGLFESSATFKKHTAAKLAFISLGLFDLVLTIIAVNLGLFEINPLIRFLIQVPALLVVVKLLIPILIAWLLPGKLLLPSIALLAVVVMLNARELIVYLV
jgi:Domain of unknown function (DUF5658)